MLPIIYYLLVFVCIVIVYSYKLLSLFSIPVIYYYVLLFIIIYG